MATELDGAETDGRIMTTPDDLTHELRRLELAIARHDSSASPGGLSSLLHPDFFEFGSSGRVWRLAQTLHGLARPNSDVITIDDFTVHPLADGAVLATYRMTEIPLEGEPRRRNRSSIWVRLEQRWVMRFHQGTPAA